MQEASAPPPVDLRAEQKRVRRQAIYAGLVCLLVLVAASFGLPPWFAFPDEMAERLAFVLRADLVVALWVVVAIRIVAKIRFESPEDNAGSAFSPPSPRLAVPAAFLQNTLEQAFIAIVGHLALATMPGEAPLAYVVGAVALFCLGRVTFLRGYPRGAGGRAFGIATTAIPTVGAYAWVLVALVFDLIW
ncbi:MAG: MAPEG family protein [Phenylobacterium sp.]|nr:MAPEG family protein [Phenylobacterium sp.]